MADLKITHVIQSLASAMGGPPAAVRQLAERQASSGFDVSVFHGGPHDNEPSDDRFTHAKPGPRFNHAPTSRSINEGIRTSGSELVHVHGVWDPIVRHTVVAAKRQGIPVVLSTHGMLHPLALARHGFRKHVYLRVFAPICSWPAMFICLNQEEGEWAKTRLGVRTAVIGHGLASEEFQSYAAPDERSTNEGALAPFLLFVGRLERIKGIDLLIEAFSRSESCRVTKLVIAGPDHGEMRRLTRQCDALGVTERVVFLGAVDQLARRKLLANALLFVHRPRYEGFGLAVAEAMASRTPVLTTNACKLPGAAEAGAFRVSRDESRAFAREIDALVKSADARSALATRARTWAEANLTWSSVIRRHQEAYDYALRSKRS